ncbi:MAG TPA: type II secretion system F family protein [Gemmatimonadaceae bacterium]
MPLSLVLLLAVFVVALAAAAYSLQASRERRALLARAGAAESGGLLAIKTPEHTLGSRLSAWLLEHSPSSWRSRPDEGDVLIHAGFDGAAAPAVYVLIRVVAALLLPAAALLIAPSGSLPRVVLLTGSALVVGLLAPPAVVHHLAGARQERLRRAVPDALDLLVVCVEAGISLDAALLRVARELGGVHPELADELMIVNRRVNAGMPRERALHGVWVRTGVDELRGLAANMIQSEKWGTSIATVLRVYAETLRRKRRQSAEKRAATAPLKMLFPLALFILPALFIVVLGPAGLKIAAMFKTITH